MCEPLALCIEDPSAGDGPGRYVQCVALAGGEPGLGVDRNARPLWNSREGLVFLLCVSGDDRLVLFRPDNAEPADVFVHRSGRSVAAEPCKPVVLLDKDRVQIGLRTLRVHIHGAAEEIHEPRALAPQPARWKFRTAAASLVLGAAIGASSGSASGQTPAPQQPPDGGDSGGAGGNPDAGTESDASEDRADAEIEVRDLPPVIVRRPAGCCARSPGEY